MEIGKRIRELRAAKKLSQGDLEKRTGLLRCYISRVENGHTVPALETLERLAAALEVEVYQLFYEGEGKPQVVPIAGTAVEDKREKELLTLYRESDSADKRFLLDLARRTGKKAA
jgi:transcriptional regulator with XRE-family HTH domain